MQIRRKSEMDLKAIKERCEAASVGPWECDGKELMSGGITLFSSGGGEYCHPDKDDAAFIAHARTDVPELLRWVERAKKILIDVAYSHDTGFLKLGDGKHRQIVSLLAELTDAGEG